LFFCFVAIALVYLILRIWTTKTQGWFLSYNLVWLKIMRPIKHIVRLAEIRIAKRIGIEDLEEMRNFNIKENGFILLPDAEKLVEEYENNRNKYENFQQFVPKLIEQLKSFEKLDIYKKIEEINQNN
jgi:hypothetical protein